MLKPVTLPSPLPSVQQGPPLSVIASVRWRAWCLPEEALC